MPDFIDQTGRKISIPAFPQRIISLVPSQTELLYDLGLDNKVIGITKFCMHPEAWFHSKTRIGGTKQLKMDIIHQLQPDLIIANKEENVKEQVEELAEQYPVWISDVNDLSSAFDMIEQIGLITGKHQPALELIQQIKETFWQHAPDSQTSAVALASADKSNFKPRTAYLIWQKPFMTAGGDTFIHSMLDIAGFDNIYADKNRYPEITIDDLLIANCQLLFLSSEPFPFKEKHAEELRTMLPDTTVMLVDGELFSWYGSRLQYAPAYFEKLRKQLL